jgi:hypothetical protein
MATRQDLEKALRLIGWHINNSHNGLNDWVYNHNNKRTNIRFEGRGEEKIEIKNEEAVFGKNSNGCIIFYLKECDIEINLESNAVNLFPKGTKGTGIAFYNFELNLN